MEQHLPELDLHVVVLLLHPINLCADALKKNISRVFRPNIFIGWVLKETAEVDQARTLCFSSHRIFPELVWYFSKILGSLTAKAKLAAS